MADAAASLLGSGRLEEAEAAHRAALGLDPDNPALLCNHAFVCLRLGRLAQAEGSARKALRTRPGFFEAQVNLGNILIERVQLDEAIAVLGEAVHQRPDSAVAWLSLGYAHAVKGEFVRAQALYEQALGIEPANVLAHVYRGRLLQAQGRYAEAWGELEWRRHTPGAEPLHRCYARVPAWDGTPLCGRKLLVYGEQGLGDELMLASCLPEVLARGGECVVDCDPRLVPLLRRSFPRASVHGRDLAGLERWLDAIRPDVAIAAGSLPMHLRRSAGDFPAHAGYVRAAPERVEGWRKRLAEFGSRQTIGLSWRGGTADTGALRRSLALDALSPILRLPDTCFVNLQYGSCAGELAQLRQAHGIVVHHWPEAVDDYDETAALVSALDLTISVCTAVVHLAGALGRPVWVMAPLFPEARYGLEGETMPWYPTARMFRQRVAGDWQQVIEDVTRALHARPPVA